MDEATWLTSEDPAAMLRRLLEWPSAITRDLKRHPLASDRKLRLFACACWRRLWPYDAAEADAPELHADGLASLPVSLSERRWVNHTDASIAARDAASSLWAGSIDDRRFGAALLREIVGNPFRSVDPFRDEPDKLLSWFNWQGGVVPALAQAIYDERRWDELPVLADALEDAGCDSEHLLRHLRGWRPCYYCADNPAIDVAAGEWCTYCGHERWLTGDFGPGPHFRGCWALDLVLGKS